MTKQRLLARFQKTWLQKINHYPPDAIPLQAIADVIGRWKRLLPSCYAQLEINAEGCSRELSDAVGWASRTLALYRFFGAAAQLLIDAWKETGKSQTKTTDKVYRAGIGFYLSELYLQQGDKGAAFWWQLHALADDYLENGGGGGAKIVLETILGIPKGQLFDNLEAIAHKHLETCKQIGWQARQGFAEDVVVEFATRHPQYASMFAYPTSEVEFPISPGYLDVLLRDIEDDKQGKNLEYVACYLFMHIPGCTPAHNLSDLDGTMQTDVVIRNLTPQGNLSAETFGRHFIIECKNWAVPIGSPECGYFLHRIHIMHFNFGVILAKNGITGSQKAQFARRVAFGDSDVEAARQLIRRSFHEDGVTCIVLTLDHLQKLANESTTLRAILFEEIEQFRYGKSNSAM
jgi:hypothetical protein